MGKKHALVRLLEAFEEEKIRYVVIGMSAAIAQGVIANTLDVDIWVDLLPREYMRVQNLALKAGATIAANTVVYLEDGTPVNFIYEVTGLSKFSQEARSFIKAPIYGVHIPVLHLKRILKSKEAIGRDKDKLHILLLKEFLKCRREAKRPR